MNTCNTCNTGLQSIRRAHANIKPGKLRINSGELLDANANRSPSAYLHNPEDERARYKHNTDKIMTQLSVTNSEGKGKCTGKMVPQVCKHVHQVSKAGVPHGTMYGDTTLDNTISRPVLSDTYSSKDITVSKFQRTSFHLFSFWLWVSTCMLSNSISLCTLFFCFAPFSSVLHLFLLFSLVLLFKLCGIGPSLLC